MAPEQELAQYMGRTYEDVVAQDMRAWPIVELGMIARITAPDGTFAGFCRVVELAGDTATVRMFFTGKLFCDVPFEKLSRVWFLKEDMNRNLKCIRS